MAAGAADAVGEAGLVTVMDGAWLAGWVWMVIVGAVATRPWMPRESTA